MKGTADTTVGDILKAVEENHIWLNAFLCIKPTPEFCQEVGRLVLSMLDEKERLLPSYNADLSIYSETGKKAVREISRLTPVLYLSVNKS
jgi:hypothetical protein